MTDYLCLHIGVDCQLHLVQTHRDYDGEAKRTLLHVTRHKGMGYERVAFDGGEPRPLFLAGLNLIIPCTRAATDRIVNFLEMQHLMGEACGISPRWKGNDTSSANTRTRGPYYYTVDMRGACDFEGRAMMPHFIGGAETPYAKKLTPGFLGRALNAAEDMVMGPEKSPPVNNPERIPFARYNCWTATQGLVEHVAGISLDHVGRGLNTAFRAQKATDMADDILERIAEGDREYTTKKVDHSTFIARRNDGPPFILTRRSESLSVLLDTPVEGSPRTVEQLIEVMGVVAPKPMHTKAQAPAGHAP